MQKPGISSYQFSNKKFIQTGSFLAILLFLAIAIAFIGGFATERGRYNAFNLGNGGSNKTLKSIYLQLKTGTSDRYFYSSKIFSKWNRATDFDTKAIECYKGSDGEWVIFTEKKTISVLVPIKFINDLPMPIVYQTLSKELSLHFPFGSMEYVDFYLNRNFNGVYLLVNLPLGKAYDNQEYYELLSIESGTMHCLSSSLTSSCSKYSSFVEQGAFPSLSNDPTHTLLATLNLTLPEPRIYLLDNGGKLMPFPVPFDVVRSVSKALNVTKEAVQVTDSRFLQLSKVTENSQEKTVNYKPKRAQRAIKDF